MARSKIVKPEPPKQLMFSHTMLTTYRRCKYRFYLQYDQGYVSPSGIGQIRGTAGHAALAEWYKEELRKKKKRDEIAMTKAWDTYLTECENNQVIPDYESGFVMLENALLRYFEWARDRDKTWQFISSEFRFEVKMPNGHTLQGYIDGVVRYQDNVWLLENKFHQRVETAHLDLDPQVGVYLIGSYLSGYTPVGVIYNIIRMGDGPTSIREPVVRKVLYRNPEGLEYKVQELVAQMDEMINNPLTEDIQLYRNETKDCAWDCPFYNVCLSLNDNGDPFPVLDVLERSDKGSIYDLIGDNYGE